MHTWGDGFPYFKEVGEAASFIGEFCVKWGRIQVRQYKEKHGTTRVYCSLYCECLHDLLYPGYVYIRGNYKLMTFPFLRWLRPLIYKYQKFIYKLAYMLAIRKYPMIKQEILWGADYPELLGDLLNERNENE